MFQNKKTILIGAGVILAIALGVGIFFYLKNKNTTTVNVNNPTTTTGTGTAQQGQNYSTGQITIHQDATQPFAVALPRQTPAQALQNTASNTPGTGSGNGSGQSAQSADYVGISQSDLTNPDYQLSDSQFLAKYYTDANSVINVNSPGYQQAFASDPVLTVNNSNTTSGLNVTSTRNGGTIMNTTNDNSIAAIGSYLQKMADITGSFDIVGNPGYIQTILSNPSKTMIASDIQKATAILAQIKGLPVPGAVQGLSQNYAAVYSDYVQMLTDLGQVGATTTTTVNGKQVQTATGDDAALAGQINLDANNLSADIAAVNGNLSTITSYIQSH